MKNWRNKPMSEVTKNKIKVTCQRLYKEGKLLQNRKMTQETKDKIRKALQIHHIDLNRRNNKEENLIRKMTNGRHQKLHRFAYHYLLEKYGLSEIKRYFSWFNQKYPQ